MKIFLKEVNIYEIEREDGRILKRLKFHFSVLLMARNYTNLIGTTKVPLRQSLC